MAEQLAGFQFAKPFDVTNPVSTDKRYGKFNGSITTPFASKAEALDLIKPALRYQGLQCVIANGASIGLYWWRDGVADEQLVLLQTDVDISGKADKAYVDSQDNVEATARQNADSNLQGQVTINTNALTTKAEISDLDSKIASEKSERQLADADLVAGITSGDTATLNAAKTYTDSQVAAIYRSAGDWDTSINNSYPISGTGTIGTIRRGDAYNIVGGGNIGLNYYQPGDTIYAKVNNPGQIETNWGTFDTNQQQATEALRGIAKIATQSTIENETTIEDQTLVTPKKFWQGIARTLGIPRIVSGLWTFLDGMRFGSPGFYATFAKSLTSNSLTLKNNVYQAGAIGRAIKLNGTTQRGSFANLPITSVITISSWFKTTQTSVGVIVKIGTAGNGCYYVGANGNFIRINDNTGSQGVAAGTNVSDGNWHHTVVVNNASITKVYVDGTLVGTKSGTYPNNQNGSNSFGAVSNAGSHSTYFNGNIDQTLIYNRELNQTEIVNLYNAGFGTASPNTNGLVARWEFDETSGTVANDSSGNNYNINLVNSPLWDNLGKVPTGGAPSEANVFQSLDGVTNGERGQQTFGDFAGGNIQQGKAFRLYINNYYPFWCDNFGRIFINPKFSGLVEGDGSVASAYLHLAAGKTTVGDAAMKFTAGALLASPESGAWEFDGINLYFCNNNGRIKINANLQTLTDQGNTTINDIEITGISKGIILKDIVDGTRRRILLSNGNLIVSEVM
jgi:hypothetical protein